MCDTSTSIPSAFNFTIKPIPTKIRCFPTPQAIFHIHKQSNQNTLPFFNPSPIKDSNQTHDLSTID